MQRRTTCAALFLSAPVLSTTLLGGGASGSGHPFETSEDGKLTVQLNPSATDGTVILHPQRGVAAPFGLAPDWQNTLRLAVGGIAVGDINNDGWDDLVVVAYSSAGFPPYPDYHNYIYYNDGTGQLEATPSWVSSEQLHSTDVKLADINGDTYLDILIADGGCNRGPAHIYYGGVNGPADNVADWSSNPPDGVFSTSMTPFDIDHDGDLDVVITGQGDCASVNPFRPIHFYYNQGGVLDTVPSWSSNASEISSTASFGDLDGDGWEEMGVSKWANWESGFYKNVNGILQTAPLWTTGDDSTDKGTAIGDVDGDGDNDFVLGHDDETRLYTNDGSGTLTRVWGSDPSLFVGHNDLMIADIDRDGDLDILETHFSNGHTRIFLNDGDGNFPALPNWTYDSPAVGTGLAVGDINGDCAPDLIVGNNGDNSVRVFYNTACLGDLDANAVVNLFDLLDLLAAWGTTTPGADVDCNGTVNLFDLLALLSAWGEC